MTLGEAIRTARKRLGKTTVEFASMLGVNNGTISRYENDKLQPSRSMVLFLLNYADGDEREALLAHLGVNPADVSAVAGDELRMAVEKFQQWMESGGNAGRAWKKSPSARLVEFADLSLSIIQYDVDVDPAIVAMLKLWREYGTKPWASEVFENARLYLDIELKSRASGRRGKK